MRGINIASIGLLDADGAIPVQKGCFMGDTVQLIASDGHSLDAYVARPATETKAAIVVIQEIFGVNAHIREVVDGYAAAGYLAVAPALFDRDRPKIELAYDADGVTAGRDLRAKVDSGSEADVMAAVAYAAAVGKVAIVGYCWGGSLAWRMATRADSGIAAAVSYYGGELPGLSSRRALCPMMAHFGIHDPTIPEADARRFAADQPDVACYFYDADHGFNCDHRGQYNADAAAKALAYTSAFLATHLD